MKKKYNHCNELPIYYIPTLPSQNLEAIVGKLLFKINKKKCGNTIKSIWCYRFEHINIISFVYSNNKLLSNISIYVLRV